MPKNNTRGGAARAPKSFDPRYGDRKKATRTIGRGHRGFNAAADEAPKKGRWSDEQRAGRDTARDIAGGRGARDDRSGGFRGNRDGGFRSERSDRDFGGRSERSDRFDRNERGGERRSFGDRDGGARGGRGDRDFGGRDERRSFGDRDDRRAPRAARDSNGNRPPREDRGFRPDRDERRDGRPARNDRFDRPARNDRAQQDERRGGFNRDERGGRDFNRDDRGARGFNRDDRGGRGFDRSERPQRDERRGGFNRDDRGGRDFNRDDRGARSFSRDDRGARGFDRSDRGGRGADARPDADFQAARDRFRDDRRGGRSGGRPMRNDATKPNRGDWNASASKRQEQEDRVLERLQAQSISATDVENTTFADLGMGQNIVRVLAELGAEKPFPIQAATIPVILEGRDTLGRGRTGSGKTIAFGAPLVERVLRAQAGTKREHGRAPMALILAPTRELALQIDRTIQPIARSVGLFTTQIYGGVPQGRQVMALRKGVDIIIGTPGRIEDLQAQGKLDLSNIQVAVLDEADHMCELGFLEPVQRILRSTDEGSQKLLFSATLDAEVEALVKEFLVRPAVYEVAGEDQDSGTIDHRVLVLDARDKMEILTSLVTREGKTLVFTRTRAYAETLAEEFNDAGLPAVALHGDLTQARRTRNLEKVSRGKANVLVATDVAARGIHVDDIDLVIQADAPLEYKTYLHRAGRTGRAGREGTVVTMTTRGRMRRIGELLERAEIKAPFQDVRPGDDLIEELSGRAMSIAELTA